METKPYGTRTEATTSPPGCHAGCTVRHTAAPAGDARPAALGGLPITVKFSRLVGEIMREVPGDREPLPQFKFYI